MKRLLQYCYLRRFIRSVPQPFSAISSWLTVPLYPVAFILYRVVVLALAREPLVECGFLAASTAAPDYRLYRRGRMYSDMFLYCGFPFAS